MKPQTLFISIGLAVAVLVGIKIHTAAQRTARAEMAEAPAVHTTMPPGWKLVCDDRGHYGPKDIDGWIWGNARQPMTKQQAIDYAWETVEWEERRKTGPWHECEPAIATNYVGTFTNLSIKVWKPR